MTVIHRYITASFMKYFFIVLAMVVCIYLSVDFFGRIDNFIESDKSYGAIALFFLFKIPLIVSQITPVGVLLAVLIIFGLMSKNNEVTALKSGGISVFYLLRPIAAIGLIFSVLLFMFAEIMVPISISNANRISETKGRERRAVSLREKNIWVRHQKKIVHVKHYHPADKVIYGVSIYFFDEDFNLSRRIDAASAGYVNGKWRLADCMEQSFAKAGTGAAADRELGFPDAKRVEHYAHKDVSMGLTPADLKRVARESEEMSFTALLNYIRKAESEGYDATKYRVDLYGKTAFPLVCLIMSLMGAAIALRSNTGDGMAVSFAYGIMIAFLYWSLYSFSLSLGYGNVLPAWIAAWSANIIFACAAGAMLLNLE